MELFSRNLPWQSSLETPPGLPSSRHPAGRLWLLFSGVTNVKRNPVKEKGLLAIQEEGWAGAGKRNHSGSGR
jgi:hypothetical protein